MRTRPGARFCNSYGVGLELAAGDPRRDDTARRLHNDPGARHRPAGVGSPRACYAVAARASASLEPSGETLPEDRNAVPGGMCLLQQLQHLEDHRKSEEHTSELQSQSNLVCRLLLEKKNRITLQL